MFIISNCLSLKIIIIKNIGTFFIVSNFFYLSCYNISNVKNKFVKY